MLFSEYPANILLSSSSCHSTLGLYDGLSMVALQKTDPGETTVCMNCTESKGGHRENKQGQRAIVLNINEYCSLTQFFYIYHQHLP
jgi:hypothetical protein